MLVAGLGSAGFAAADALIELGARVLVVDEAETDHNRDRAGLLEQLDAEVRLGPGSTVALPVEVDLVIASPGWRPDQPLLAAAAGSGVPI